MERAKDFFSFSFLKEKVHNLNMQSSTIHINRTLLRSTDGISDKLNTETKSYIEQAVSVP